MKTKALKMYRKLFQNKYLVHFFFPRGIIFTVHTRKIRINFLSIFCVNDMDTSDVRLKLLNKFNNMQQGFTEKHL